MKKLFKLIFKVIISITIAPIIKLFGFCISLLKKIAKTKFGQFVCKNYQKVIHFIKKSRLLKWIKILIRYVKKFFHLVRKIINSIINFYKKTFVHLFIKWIIRLITIFYRRNRKAIWGYLFISLWLIGYLVFTLTPIIQSFNYSLNKAKFELGSIKLEFLKFENYRHALFVDLKFMTLLVSYISQIILVVPIAIVFALLIAMLINQKIKGRSLWRVIFFLPVVISTGPVIRSLTSQGASTVPLLNNVNLHSFIMQNLPAFVYRPVLSLFGQIILILWYTGIPTLIFLAGLQKIDRSIYEAAAIDGASPWESFWKVTLPAVKQFITVNVIYVFVTLSYYSGFSGNDIIDYIREQSFDGGAANFGFGYGSAIAWIFFLTIVILISIFVGLLNLKRD